MEKATHEEITMLQDLIKLAKAGKRMDLKARPVRDKVRFEQKGRDRETVILSMEYSGTADGSLFGFKKSYAFAEEDPRQALLCVMIANNRVKMDNERLREGGIHIRAESFTFKDAFMDLPGGLGTEDRPLRLQNFIGLAGEGGSVSVEIVLKTPNMTFQQDNMEKKGFGCTASFVFTTREGLSTVEKLYALSSYIDTKEFQSVVKRIATARLERDCERLRRAGMKVENKAF
ncbi:MAG: hypothetical protein ABIG67_08365 [Pseudomonadota bacterium]